MKTDSKALQGLFDKFADLLKETLEDGKAVIDKDSGEIVRVTPDAATLNVVRQFLKDTNTTIVPGTNETVNDIAKNLPFSSTDEDHEDYTAH